MTSKRHLARAAVALIAGSLAPWAYASPAPRGAALVLAARDIPGKTVLIPSETGVNSNAEIAKTTSAAAAQLARWGRITGYQRVFASSASGSFAGQDAEIVLSAVNLCKTEAGAHAYFLYSSHSLPLSKPVSIGDEGSVSKTTLHKQRHVFITSRVVWRSGKIAAILIFTTYKGQHPRTDVLALARRQQARIAASR